MTKPISLRLSNHAIAKARATLERLGRADELKRQDNARTLRQARKNIARGEEYTRLRRSAKLAGLKALHSIRKAYAAADRINPSLSPSEQEHRALVEAEFKRIAGLP